MEHRIQWKSALERTISEIDDFESYQNADSLLQFLQDMEYRLGVLEQELQFPCKLNESITISSCKRKREEHQE
jgi:hypothetical protein